MRFVLFTFICVAGLRAQSEGIIPEWEARQLVNDLSANVTRLRPMIAGLDTGAWVAKGASDTYRSQVQSAQNQMQYLAAASERLAARPDRLSAGLETYFRYQALEAMIESLAEGLRRYESPQKGDALVSAMAESASYRDRLRQYLVDLAASKEQEFAVADREAQRCRGILAADPPAGAGRKQGRK